ncbi:MAG TPA: Mrp/NBP35 family ATP-binding protein [Candidatus Kapabacteria bacterium]|nr:Mrp/NBP35 family ATP-binding protein [Candidatus Kapabacteria bacterium]
MNVEQIKQIIGKLEDPHLGLSWSALDAIKKIEVFDDKIILSIDLVGPIVSVSNIIKEQIIEALSNAGIKANIEVTFNEICLDRTNRQFLKEVKHIIAVASGKGGVGKSAIAGNIAAALSKMGLKVGLLDADVYGPSQPTMFGLKEAKLEAITDSHGNTVAIPIKRDENLFIASMGFVLNRNEAAIVRGPMLASYFSLLFEQIEWGELDVLVFDLPPGTGDIQLTLVQKVPLNGAVIVTTPQKIALADVRRSIAMFRKVNVDILGIVENMSYFVPPDMPDRKYYIFGKDGGKIIAYEENVPLLGQIPLDIEMREANDGGEPVALTDKYPVQARTIKETTLELIKELRKHNYENLNKSIEIEM